MTAIDRFMLMGAIMMAVGAILLVGGRAPWRWAGIGPFMAGLFAVVLSLVLLEGNLR